MQFFIKNFDFVIFFKFSRLQILHAIKISPASQPIKIRKTKTNQSPEFFFFESDGKETAFLTDFFHHSKSETLDLWKVNTECNSILLFLFPQPGGEINTMEWHKIRYLLLWFHHFSNKPASKACLYISCRWINHDQSSRQGQSATCADWASLHYSQV